MARSRHDDPLPPFPEGNDTVVSKGPCECGSSDGKVTYGDGHTHCFVCSTTLRPDGGAREGGAGGQGRPDHAAGPVWAATGSCPLLNPADYPGAHAALPKRGLTADTLRRYGYFLGRFKGETVHVAPYFDQEGEPAGQKLRLPNKDFVVLKAHEAAPSVGVCRLFGHHVYGDRFNRTVVVTEGELDAMSVAQEIDFKIAAVSVNTGSAGAAKCLKANYLWLDRFDEIILWFDDDEAGQAAVAECAPLFRVGKVRVAKVPGCKDASDVLQAGRPGDIKSAIYMATAYRPAGIKNARDNPGDTRAPENDELSWSYPPSMAKLQEMTGGMYPGEVTYHVAGTGVGKSAALREIQYHLIQQGVKIGVLAFEDTVRDAKFGLMSLEANERLHLVSIPPKSDVAGRAAYNARMDHFHQLVFGSGLVELFDPETAEWTMEAILGYVRYLAKALDCWAIFVDPLTFVAAGVDLTADERRVLDKIAAEFAKLAKELGVHLQISHHLKRTQGVPHEEGAPTSLNEVRSSGGLANFATGVVGWERNNQAEGDAWRVTRNRVIKPIRRTGRSGLADVLYYGEDGRLVPSPIPFPPIGKPASAGGEAHPARGFPPVAGDY